MRRKRWEVDDGLWERIEPLLAGDCGSGTRPGAGSARTRCCRPNCGRSAYRICPGRRSTRATPLIRGKRAQPLRRPKHLYAGRGYDHESYREQVRRFEITPHITRRGTEHGSGLGD
jgi:hypothetical protein